MAVARVVANQDNNRPSNMDIIPHLNTKIILNEKFSGQKGRLLGWLLRSDPTTPSAIA